MKVSPRDANNFVRSPSPGVSAVLVYGPDAGLVRERAEILVKATVEDANDPFSVTDLSADEIKSDAARVADEIGAISFTGGRRAVRIRNAGNAQTDAIAGALDAQADLSKVDALLIVEAGDLEPRSSLRKFFESDRRAAAIACYVEEGASLIEAISSILQRHKLSADRDALEYLQWALGGDRYVVRQEIEKLAIYAHGKTTVALADAMACIGDSAARGLDDIVQAAADGNHRTLDEVLSRQLAQGVAPISILRAAIRYFQRLHLAAGYMSQGRSADQAMDSLRPKVFFKVAPKFRQQLGSWPAAALASTLDRLLEAESDCKKTGNPDALVVGRTLMGIANLAARHRRGNSTARR